MTRATLADREYIVDILSKAFINNLSVNYIIPQDDKKSDRIKHLMEYSFDVCMNFGEVLISNDKMACALISFPEIKKGFLKSTMLDFKLIIHSIGIGNIGKASTREKKIKEKHPVGNLYYLWFIGVHPVYQKMGAGTSLMNEIIERASSMNKEIILETSTESNMGWYEKLGFQKYDELNLGYRLVFFRNT